MKTTFRSASPNSESLIYRLKKFTLFSLIALISYSCDKYKELVEPLKKSDNGMVDYQILKGKNESNQHTIKPHSGLPIIDVMVHFTPSCYYELSNKKDRNDVNKLYGISWGAHHENSYRVGWNCSKLNKRIQLYSYYYNSGVNYIEYIGDCPIDSTFQLVIKFQYKENKIQTDIPAIKYSKAIRYNFLCLEGNLAGYQLYPYFGGTSPAPHTMDILLSK